MKHKCKAKDEDGLVYFEDAIIDGIIEYDDFYDAYLVFYYKEKKVLFWTKRWGTADILQFCPYCGEKIYEDA